MAPGPLETSIREKLTSRFSPTTLKISNDSAAHSHHSAMRADPSAVASGETHFSVQLVSESFEGMRLIQRHRAVNDALKEEFARGLHALQIKAKTPQEVEP